MTEDRPLCACHGERMVRNGRDRGGIQRWACRTVVNERRRVRYHANPEAERARTRAAYAADPEAARARMRARYDGLSGYEYNALLLAHRRTKALARMGKRNPDILPREA